MNAPQLEPQFRAGLRRTLEDFAAQPEARRPARLSVIGGLSLALLAVGGTAATAGGLLPLPGGEQVTELGKPITMTGSGTGTLSLDAVPDDATKLRVEVSCLSGGRFEFPGDAGSLTCSQSDVDGGTGAAWIDIPLEQLGDTVTISSSPGARWSLSVTYLDAQPVPIATNATGDTYGISNAPEGQPDLISVIATNGRTGYVWADELADADGTTAMKGFRSPEDALAWQAERQGESFAIPVYLSDGVTAVGEFVIGPG